MPATGVIVVVTEEALQKEPRNYIRRPQTSYPISGVINRRATWQCRSVHTYLPPAFAFPSTRPCMRSVHRIGLRGITKYILIFLHEVMMGPYGWLVLYSGAILAVSLIGGSVPFLGRVTHSRLQLYLSLSAGVMLGASFFHVMPDAMQMAGAGFGWWMALGVVGLFCIERFLAPHSHEVSSKLQMEHEHEPGCEHDHEHRAAPSVAGWMAVLGLTIHTFMNGVGLAGAVQHDVEMGSLLEKAIPGFALFL